MGRFKLWTLKQDNTSPFVIVAVLYSLFLAIPFVYFMYLHSEANFILSKAEYEYNMAYEEEMQQQQYPPAGYVEKTQDSLSSGSVDTLTATGSVTDAQDTAKEEKKKEEKEYNWREDKESGPFVLLTRVAIFSAVLAFGAIGAAVSLITRARNKGQIGNITALELISIQTIGAIFAFILTLIFVADFIGGRLFPEPDLFYRIIYVHPAFAKLLIWSFIAGFSERFVPNILNNLVKNAKENNEDETSKNE